VKILCFLQNQWDTNAEKENREWAQLRARAGVEMYLEVRKRIITNYILYGRSFTARRIQAAFKEHKNKLNQGEPIHEIIFENASPLVGDKASSKFPADLVHMAEVIGYNEPDFVIAFGAVARDGLQRVWPSDLTLALPHPAARQLLDEWVHWYADLEKCLQKLENRVVFEEKALSDVST
jgi:hypothetical protein